MTKAEYQRRIWTYKKRREIFKKRIWELTKKISQWNNEVKRIERTDDKLKKILKCVNEYFGVDISEKTCKPKYRMARNIYYKFAIESKIQGKLVSNYINRSNKNAGECRLYFTRGFEKNPGNRKAFHDFKKYFEIHEQ